MHGREGGPEGRDEGVLEVVGREKGRKVMGLERRQHQVCITIGRHLFRHGYVENGRCRYRILRNGTTVAHT